MFKEMEFWSMMGRSMKENKPGNRKTEKNAFFRREKGNLDF